MPLWVKIVQTVFVLYMIPAYWHYYGPQNFLWVSDIALFVSTAALWLNSSLLASMMTLAVIIPELGWNIEFFGQLISGKSLFGLSSYMFSSSIPLSIRLLSLFHVWLPVVLLWMIWRLGYNQLAWPLQTAAGTAAFILSYFLTDPAKNINWVFGLGSRPQHLVAPWLYLTAVIVFFVLAIYTPTHFLLKHFFAR